MLKPILQPQQPPKRVILTISQLNRQAKSCLESQVGTVWLSGEISNLTKAASGHWYFSLKDDNAQIKAAMFRFKTHNLSFSPTEGDMVVVKGKVSLYEARGDYQLIADYMEPAGEGALQLKLRELQKKLNAEGLFSPELKKPLPLFSKSIGVITSPTGAAIHDVLSVLKRRCPMIPVIIYPTQVQGTQAAKEIIAALETAERRNECDVLLITRGGGSIEDLWSFNDEQLARRIAQSTLPIVAAIGHEVDVTITELVADLRAPTPSAAAELLVPEQQALKQQVDLLERSLTKSLLTQLEAYQIRLNIARLKTADPSAAILTSNQRLEKLKQQLSGSLNEKLQQLEKQVSDIELRISKVNPKTILDAQSLRANKLENRLHNSWKKLFEKRQNHFLRLASSLETLSPLKTMGRGYAINRDDESRSVINSVEQLNVGQCIEMLFTDGRAKAKVTSIEK